jgi:hypothetical protein
VVVGAVVAGAVVVGVVVVGAWWAGGRPWPTTTAHVTVLAVIGVVVVTTVAAGWGRQRWTSRTWIRATVRRVRDAPVRYRLGVALWALLAAAAVAWDLASFTGASHQLPTFSRLAGDLTGHRAGRALALVAWVVVGLALALAGRKGPDRR